MTVINKSNLHDKSTSDRKKYNTDAMLWDSARLEELFGLKYLLSIDPLE
ncbi:hypothetical protein OAK48_01910 [Deltaproteobacteria bacterium]|nr:hypothetical protein [Deltaproteobacteria bacterium]